MIFKFGKKRYKVREFGPLWNAGIVFLAVAVYVCMVVLSALG